MERTRANKNNNNILNEAEKRRKHFSEIKEKVYEKKF